MDIEDYFKNWEKFRVFINNKTKNRCIVTNKNWVHLRKWHLENYLKQLESPFGFLFNIKYFNPDLFRNMPFMHEFYNKYNKKRIDNTEKVC